MKRSVGIFQKFAKSEIGKHLCVSDIDECASGPCQNGGTCMDGMNGYVCQCPPEWTDTHCDLCTFVMLKISTFPAASAFFNVLAMKVYRMALEFKAALDLDVRLVAS